MKTLFAAALALSFLAAPAMAQHSAAVSGASDPSTPKVALHASNETVYGPGYTAPIHDGWG
jgi:hypothetical protein